MNTKDPSPAPFFEVGHARNGNASDATGADLTTPPRTTATVRFQWDHGANWIRQIGPSRG
jgi:hypothetical protein